MQIICIILAEEKYEDLQVPYFDPTHTYSIQQLQRPLSCREIGFITRPLGLTHAGLGFIDEQDPTQRWSVQYNSKPHDYEEEFNDNIYPNMTWNEESQLWEFAWRKLMSIYIQDTLNTEKCEWEDQYNVTQHVKGSLLNEWLSTYGQYFHDKYYNYYNQYEAWFEGEDRNRWNDLHSEQCHDFVWWSMQWIAEKDQSLVWKRSKVIPRIYAYYTIHKQEDVRWLNESNPIDNEILYKYYKEQEDIWSEIGDEQLYLEMHYTGEIESIRMARQQARMEPYSVIFLNDDKYYLAISDKLFWFEVSEQLAPGTD